jgi:hypothetical protein
MEPIMLQDLLKTYGEAYMTALTLRAPDQPPAELPRHDAVAGPEPANPRRSFKSLLLNLL